MFGISGRLPGYKGEFECLYFNFSSLVIKFDYLSGKSLLLKLEKDFYLAKK